MVRAIKISTLIINIMPQQRLLTIPPPLGTRAAYSTKLADKVAHLGINSVKYLVDPQVELTAVMATTKRALHRSKAPSSNPSNSRSRV